MAERLAVDTATDPNSSFEEAPRPPPTHARGTFSVPDGAAMAGQYLGPALVAEVDGLDVVMEMPHGERVKAKLALAYLYEPVPGDVLLVIGNQHAHYAIGVLHATGKVNLTFRGDVDLRAVDGKLRLSADRGVIVDGPEIEMQAGKLRIVADSLVERLDSVFRRVTSLLSVHAGRTHTAVDGASTTQAESVTMLSKEVVTINGKQIQLG